MERDPGRVWAKGGAVRAAHIVMPKQGVMKGKGGASQVRSDTRGLSSEAGNKIQFSKFSLKSLAK